MHAAQGHGMTLNQFFSPAFRLPRWCVALAAIAVVLAGPAVTSAFAKPEYVNAPEVVGGVRVGERLVCSSGTWKGSPSFSYEWIREGVGFTTGPTYYLQRTDEHKEIWCVVTATEKLEPTSPPLVGYAESSNGICLGGGCGIKEPPEAPVNKGRPIVSGGSTVGSVLTCSQGTWSGRPAPTFAYKWLRDAKEAIPSASASTYTIAAADETHSLSCRVTASNEAGEATAESENSVPVKGFPPTNVKKPEVLGVPSVNETLTCAHGQWNGSEPISYQYSWRRNGSLIPGATASIRVVEAADEGKELSCSVTASNGLGSNSAVSAGVLVNSVKLESTVAPQISPAGAASEGTKLTCSDGGWNEPTGELKFTYNWLRDRTATVGFAREYTVGSTDRGHLLYCQVTATNQNRGQQKSALSEPVAVPKGPGVPVKEGSEAVEVVGELSLGSTLNCKHGGWSNSPTLYVYQWRRDSIPIAVNGEGVTYVVQSADRGHLVSCRVVAENAEGPSEPADSAQEAIGGELPNGGPAEVSGSSPTHVGEALSCLRGAWKGAPTPTFTYEWLRDVSEKVGEGAAYTVQQEDRGHKISCAVTAHNGGSQRATSAGVYVPGILPEPPLEGARIGGAATVESVLTCEPGIWSGAPAPAFTYRWSLNGIPVAGQTGATYTVGSAARGFVVSCSVTGTNSEGTASSLSPGVHVAGVPPKVVAAPFISGSASVGATLTCQRGVWEGRPPPSFTYEWQRDGVGIASATEAGYSVEPADQGHLLSCVVMARNSEGSLGAASANNVAISSHLTQTETETTHITNHSGKPGLPSAGVIIAAINRQLTYALEGVHLKSVLKAGGYKFAFIAPTAGTFEVQWYLIAKGAHGARSKHLVVAQLTTSYTGSKNSTLKIKLTNKGRQILKGKKRLSLRAMAVFTIPGGKPVTWTGSFTLSH